MNGKALRAGIFLLLALCLLSVSVASAAKKDLGHVIDSDYSCKGVMLGDSEEELLKKFGEPMFDKEVKMQGVPVKVYSFKDHYDVAVSLLTKQVVDFKVDNESYVARNNVRYGTTSYWLAKTYGKRNREYLDGDYWYIYERPNHPHQRLMLKVDADDSHLLGFRITALPLTDAEQEEMEVEDESLFDDTQMSELIASKEIDTSALPQDDGNSKVAKVTVRVEGSSK